MFSPPLLLLLLLTLPPESPAYSSLLNAKQNHVLAHLDGFPCPHLKNFPPATTL